MPMIPRSHLLTAIVAALAALVSQQGVAAATPARISGIVTDVKDSWVVKAHLAFEGQDRTYQVETDGAGKYSISLPPGTYTASVKRFGFCELRRGEFIAATDSRIEFNFQLWVCPIDSSGYYNYTELRDANGHGLKPLVLHGKTLTGDGFVTFTGPGNVVPEYPVVLTFDRFTFVADRLTYNSATRLVLAAGNVSWKKDSAEPRRASKIEISFAGTSPIVQVLSN
jgi:carboxypeptidase family protein